MSGDPVRRVLVWSGLVRALHWAMALCTLALIGSAWAMQRAPQELGAAATVLHRDVGYLLLAALAARLYLLVFGHRTERWQDCVPWPPQHRAALQMLRFYLSFGRAPLPAYYAHNPLWGPIYLGFFALLVFQGATGLLGPPGWHAAGYPWVVGFAVLHVLAAFVHDWKGSGADVSAMINGHRVFVARRAEEPAGAGPHQVSVDSLLKTAGRGGRPPGGPSRPEPGTSDPPSQDAR
jgi:Ni/Fe-hydrogenase 1 B-type cytochrome subunit